MLSVTSVSMVLVYVSELSFAFVLRQSRCLVACILRHSRFLIIFIILFFCSIVPRFHCVTSSAVTNFNTHTHTQTQDGTTTATTTSKEEEAVTTPTLNHEDNLNKIAPLEKQFKKPPPMENRRRPSK